MPAQIVSTSIASTLLPAEFFVLRTPLLPFDDLIRWVDGITTPALVESGADSLAIDSSWTADSSLLRARLLEIVERPEVRHALFVASPTLDGAVERWKINPHGRSGLQAERALVRYFARMSSRATPFGLFAGCSTGKVLSDNSHGGTALVLRHRSENRLSSRLDFDYLWALTTHLRKDPELIQELQYFPNDSLHKVADSWNYVESRPVGTSRSHHLVRIESDRYLEAALSCASVGASLCDLTEAIWVSIDGQAISRNEVRAFVLELIDNDVLVPNLRPPVTSDSPLDDIISQLETLPSGLAKAACLRSARDGLAALDELRVGIPRDGYQRIAAGLEQDFPTKVNIGRLYQVDMTKPVHEAVLSRAVMDEIVAAIGVLCQVGKTQEPEVLGSFREAFLARYDRAEVPLLEALDEEIGVGFGARSPCTSLLLSGIHTSIRARDRQQSQQVADLLRRKVVAAGPGSNAELVISSSELTSFASIDTLPDSFDVMVTLAASSAAALRMGEFSLTVNHGHGPNSGKFMARFCHADSNLKQQLRDLLQKEEASDPEKIYAEVVYLPEGRAGNVLCRPVLRNFEISYLGRSGARQECILPASDLMISVTGGHVRLRSKRLGREIIPRLTSAHAYSAPQLDRVYQLLCYLQNQHGTGVPAFSWGRLTELDFLPRVRIGRLILALARWRLQKDEIKQLLHHSGSRRYLEMQRLRHRRFLPRWVVLSEGDNALHVDLDNPLSVDAFVHALGQGREAILQELFPAPGASPVTGPEGHFQHELIIPFVRQRQTSQALSSGHGSSVPPAVRRALESPGRRERTFPPGSEWLYVKIYGGTAVLDRILSTAVGELASSCLRSKIIQCWFFVRYADPQPHLRIRFNATPRNIGDVLSVISEGLGSLLSSGIIWKIQFDTYEREIERYGGLESMQSSEEIFFADSEAVLEALRQSQGDEDREIRWRLALLGTDCLLSDFGFDLKHKRRLVERCRDTWRLRLNAKGNSIRLIGDKFRKSLPDLGSVMGWTSEPTREFQIAKNIFLHRSNRIAAPIAIIKECELHGKLQIDITDLATSIIHMHFNRILAEWANEYELVLYDFLFRLYDGRLARDMP